MPAIVNMENGIVYSFEHNGKDRPTYVVNNGENNIMVDEMTIGNETIKMMSHEDAQKYYDEVSSRKGFQKSTTVFNESVLVFSEKEYYNIATKNGMTREEIVIDGAKKHAEYMYSEYGMKPLQISLHTDEGTIFTKDKNGDERSLQTRWIENQRPEARYDKDNDCFRWLDEKLEMGDVIDISKIEMNYHAHILFDNINNTNKDIMFKGVKNKDIIIKPNATIRRKLTGTHMSKIQKNMNEIFVPIGFMHNRSNKIANAIDILRSENEYPDNHVFTKDEIKSVTDRKPLKKGVDTKTFIKQKMNEEVVKRTHTKHLHTLNNEYDKKHEKTKRKAYESIIKLRQEKAKLASELELAKGKLEIAERHIDTMISDNSENQMNSQSSISYLENEVRTYKDLYKIECSEKDALEHKIRALESELLSKNKHNETDINVLSENNETDNKTDLDILIDEIETDLESNQSSTRKMR